LRHKIASEAAGILDRHDAHGVAFDGFGNAAKPDRLSIESAPLGTNFVR
jgi:hypothetical protein